MRPQPSHRRRGKHEGTVYRRKDGRWAASVSLGHSQGGSNRPFVYGRTRADVVRKLDQLRLENHLGNSAEARKTKLGKYLAAWIETDLKRKTSKDLYSTIVRNHIEPYIGSVVLGKLTPTVISRWLQTLTKRKITPSVRQHAFDTLRWALSGAVRLGMLGKNPCSSVPRPKSVPKPIVCLTPDQMTSFLRAAKEDRYYAMYVLASFGLRQGELFGLSDIDINWKEKTLTIQRGLHLVRGERSLGEPKTAASKRALRLSKFALVVLREHLKRLDEDGWTRERRLFPTPDGKSVPLLFLNTQGQPLHRPAVREHSFKVILKRALLPDCRFHDLRHSVASFLLSRYSILTVSRYLGHAKPATTLNIYGHLLFDERQEIADELDRIQAGKPSQRKVSKRR